MTGRDLGWELRVLGDPPMARRRAGPRRRRALGPPGPPRRGRAPVRWRHRAPAGRGRPARRAAPALQGSDRPGRPGGRRVAAGHRLQDRAKAAPTASSTTTGWTAASDCSCRSTPMPPAGPSGRRRGHPRRSRPTTGSSRRAGRRPGGAARSTTRSRTGSRTSSPPWSTASRAATSPPTPAKTASTGRATAATATSTGVPEQPRRPVGGRARGRRADPVRRAGRGGAAVTALDLPSDQEARERIRSDLDRDAVRRGRGGHGQDHGAGWAGGRAGHLAARVHDARGSWPPSPSPRPRPPSCGTGSASSWSARPIASTSTTTPRARVRAVLADVDEITITTLHGFASRLLGEYPLEAGLPPGFEVEDEIEASVRFDRRWVELVDDLHTDPDAAGGPRSGAGPRAPTAPAEPRWPGVFDDNWDRLGPPRGQRRPCRPVDVDARGGALGDALVERSAACTDPDDLLCEHLENHAGPIHRELVLLAEVGRPRGPPHRLGPSREADRPGGGQATVWHGAKPVVVDALRARRGRPGRRWSTPTAARSSRCWPTGSAASPSRGPRTVGVAGWSRTTTSWSGPGTCCGPTSRSAVALAGRYRYLLIDEFQDTDPLQIEIAALLAAADPTSVPERWQDVDVVPGKLFFVGDPKQSIYRFRRADIALYAAGRGRLRRRPGPAHRQLPVGARRARPGSTRCSASSSPTTAMPNRPYVDLAPHRRATGQPARRSWSSGGPVEERSIGDIRDAESEELAGLIRRMRAEGWEVGRTDRAPLRYDDVALLVPTRTPLGQIERALEAEGIPYRIESRSLVFQTDEVRELLAVLAAVDDPADEVALVTALRSPGAGLLGRRPGRLAPRRTGSGASTATDPKASRSTRWRGRCAELASTPRGSGTGSPSTNWWPRWCGSDAWSS